LKGQTVFNLLGPLTNPVQARMQLIGAFSIRAAEMLAQTASRLGTERAYVVHGADGLDEISTTGPTICFQVEEGKVQKGMWSPQDFGVETASIDDLKGGSPQDNAQIVRDILDGQPGPRRDIVVVNAAAALLLAHKAADIRGACQLAEESINSGAAKAKLEQLARFTTQHG
jgi:anthranilate phosphoribosyltransferase